MKKVVLTYFALLIILSSLLSTPLNVIANDNTDADNDSSELEMTEEVVETDSLEIEEITDSPVEEDSEEQEEITEQPEIIEEIKSEEELDEEVSEVDETTEADANVAGEIEEEDMMVRPFAELEGNFVSSFGLRIGDTYSNPLIIYNGDDVAIDITEYVSANLTYELIIPENISIADGDTYTIDLPLIYSDLGFVGNASFVVLGTNIGSYTVSNNQLVITFNENVNDLTGVGLSINLPGGFNSSVFLKIKHLQSMSHIVTGRIIRQRLGKTYWDMKVMILKKRANPTVLVKMAYVFTRMRTLSL